MPAPLSLDLRRRVLDAVVARDGTQADIARRFAVARTTVEDWARRYRQTGSVEPAVQRHGPPRLLSADDDARIARYLDEDNDLTLPEIADRFADDTGRRLGQTTVFRSLARSEVTLKKSRSTLPSA